MTEIGGIISHLLTTGKCTIADLSRTIGCSIPTTTKLVEHLVGKGLMKSLGKQRMEHGRHPVLSGLIEDVAFVAGVDIRKDRFHIGITDLSGNLRQVKTIPFNYENTQESMSFICDEALSVIRGAEKTFGKIQTVNFNISGRVNALTGESYSFFNFEENDAPLADILSQKMGIPVFIENDTRAMATCENLLGSGKQFSNFLFINASWGLGLCIIYDGKIYRGRDGYSGEIGHTNVYDNNILCHCGKRGCLETEVSGKALCRKACEQVEKGVNSHLAQACSSGKKFSEQDILQAFLHEDALAMELIEHFGVELGRQMANLINLFNPEAIIIGGTLSEAGYFLIRAIEMSVSKYALRKICQNVRIACTEIPDIGVQGACLLAGNHYIENMNAYDIDY